MNDRLIEKFGGQLEEERSIILNKLNGDKKPIDLGNDSADREEEIDKEEAFGNQLAIDQDLKNRLDEIDIALSKIYNHSFGKCEKCGKEIEAENLEIDPASRFCKKCRS